MNFPLRLQTFCINNQPLALFVPDEEVVRLAYQRGDIPFPYWSRVWPSAWALADFLLRHPHLVQGKTVVELGAGLGLPSVVAARYAHTVYCTDGSAQAVAIVQQSAQRLALANLHAAVADWQQPLDYAADVLLLSDVNYDPTLFDALQRLVQRFLRSGATVLLSTPQRLAGKAFLESLLPSCIHREDSEAGDKKTTVTVVVAQHNGQWTASGETR